VLPGASIKRTILEYSWDLGIDGLGSCGAEPLEEAREAIESAVRAGTIPRECAPRPSTILRMTTPRKHLGGARSVVCAFQYYSEGEDGPTDPSRATIAPYTRANHYFDLKIKLRMLATFMEREFGCRTKVFSCYVALAEKPLAARAGIGFYGKHGVIVTPDYGSFVVLGEILTDLFIDSDPPSGDGCGTCTRCIDACPTGAIVEPYVVDRSLCIQYLSERRGTIPRAIRETWSNRLYGCSTCQDVCPRNRGLPPAPRKVIFGRVGADLSIRDVLGMDGLGFHSRFRNNQIGIRELDVLRRNAVLAAGNSQLPGFLPVLERLASDPDPMIRLHSFWALARLAGKSARGRLEKGLKSETDPAVADEIKSLLDWPDSLG
jgi:epoxyqueuosine reductase